MNNEQCKALQPIELSRKVMQEELKYCVEYWNVTGIKGNYCNLLYCRSFEFHFLNFQFANFSSKLK